MRAASKALGFERELMQLRFGKKRIQRGRMKFAHQPLLPFQKFPQVVAA